MMLDLSKMEEVKCPDCQKPVGFVQVENHPGRFTVEGCRCDRKEYNLPEGVVFGIDGGLFTLYAPNSA